MLFRSGLERRSHGEQPLSHTRLAAIQVVALLAVAYAAALLYGWWHRSAHATFEVQFVYSRAGGMANRLRNGQIVFLDEADAPLARATIDTRRGVVWLLHPERGQCGPALAPSEYLDCFRAQSSWIAHWAEHVRHANIALEGCSMSRVRVTLYTRRDKIGRAHV